MATCFASTSRSRYLELMYLFSVYCVAESTILYVLAESHLGLAKVSPDAYVTTGGHLILSTKPEAGKFLKLKPLERVLQVCKLTVSCCCEAQIPSTFTLLKESLSGYWAKQKIARRSGLDDDLVLLQVFYCDFFLFFSCFRLGLAWSSISKNLFPILGT